MNWWLLFLLLLSSCRLIAGPSPFYDVGEYGQASAEFEKLLDTPLTTQERTIALYNIGTSLLAQGSAEKALNIYRTIQLPPDPYPLLEQNLNANYSLAVLEYAKQLVHNLSNEECAAKCDEALLLLYIGHQKLLSAERAAQRLTSLGATSAVLTTLPKIKQRLKSATEQVIALENEYEKSNPRPHVAKESESTLNKPIYHLLQAYRTALQQIPLQENSVQDLSTDMQGQFSKVQKNITLLNRLAMRYVIRNEDLPARLLLRIASTELQIQLTSSPQTSPPTPISLIKDMINIQQHALQTNATMQALEEELLTPLVNTTQERMEDYARSFLQAVIEQQKQDFNRLPPSNDQIAQCHQKWKETLALFYMAHDASASAIRALAKGQFLAAMTDQRHVLHYLKLSLSKLEHTTSTPQNAEQPQRSTQDPFDNENSTVWRLLKQMDAEDASILKPTMQSSSTNEQRPW